MNNDTLRLSATLTQRGTDKVLQSKELRASWAASRGHGQGKHSPGNLGEPAVTTNSHPTGAVSRNRGGPRRGEGLLWCRLLWEPLQGKNQIRTFDF